MHIIYWSLHASILSISLFFCTDVFAESWYHETITKTHARIPDKIDSPAFDYRLTVKFRDAWQVRAGTDGVLTSKTNRSISDTLIASKQYNLTFKRLISLPEESHCSNENRARSFGNSPISMGMMVVNIPQEYHSKMVEIGELLQNHPEVEYAYIQTIGTLHPVILEQQHLIIPVCKDTVLQILESDMDYIHSLGITGTNVQVTDCEYGYNETHEDLMDQRHHDGSQ